MDNFISSLKMSLCLLACIVSSKKSPIINVLYVIFPFSMVTTEFVFFFFSLVFSCFIMMCIDVLVLSRFSHA